MTSKPRAVAFPRNNAKTFSRVLLAVFALSSLSACGAMDLALQDEVAQEAATVPGDVNDDAAVAELGEQTAANELPIPVALDLSKEAGLDDYVEIALRDNPAITRAIREVQVLGYKVPQVTSLDDPMVNLVPPTGDLVQTAAGVIGGAFGASQKLPFPGKLTARGKIVEQSVRMALDKLADVRISTVAKVQKAYYDYYLADVSIQITRDSRQLLEQLRDVASARYSAGLAAQQDVLRAEVELYSLTNDLITLEQQKATASAQLNALMNRAVDAPLPAPRSFEMSRIDWQLDAAMDKAIASNPRLARLREQIKRDLEAVKLARLDYYPDLTAGFTYTFISDSGVSPVHSGSDAWNLGLGVNLPIWWTKLRARVLEGNAQVLASVSEFSDLRNLIFFELQDSLVKIDTEYRRAILFRDLIVPRAWQAVESSTSSYRSGALEFTALIENWNQWLDFSLAHYRAMASLEQRFADLQQLVGVELPRSQQDLGSTGIDGGSAVHPNAVPVQTSQHNDNNEGSNR